MQVRPHHCKNRDLKKIQALSGIRTHDLCCFDSSVGRALHRHRRGRGFESRSEPEFFSGLCSSRVAAALALMTVIKVWRYRRIIVGEIACISSNKYISWDNGAKREGFSHFVQVA